MCFVELENNDSKTDDQVTIFIIALELSRELRLGILIFPDISNNKHWRLLLANITNEIITQAAEKLLGYN